MIDRIKHWLGLVKENDYVRDTFDFGNMRTSLYMSTVIIALELWMIESAIYGILSGERARTMGWIASHLLLYVIMIAAASVVLIYSVKSLRRGENDHRTSRMLFMYFSVICVAFGIFISYNDYIKGEQLFTFISMIVFALCLIVWPPVVSFVISTASFIAMYLLMAGHDGASYATGVNFFVMWICILMCAMGNYAARISYARNEEKLHLANEKLKASMLIDELTGLGNRKSMIRDMTGLTDRSILVAMADVDDFKYINDTYNHNVGDEVLRRIAASIDRCFSQKKKRSGEIWFDYYRYGGDGFIFFSSGYRPEEFRSWMRSWQQEIHSEIFEGTDIHVSMSCGIVEGAPEKEDDIYDMIRYADHILYDAKRMGRMQILTEFFEEMRRKEKDGRLGIRTMSVHETDPLTGLPNMIYFRRHAGQILRDAISAGDQPEFLYLDIVNFKEFNEAYGFINGDQLLKTLAERLLQLYRNSLVARISDDHFIVLSALPDEDNMANTDKLRKTLKNEQRDVTMGIRVGVYRPENGDTDASIACDRARIACNSIKNNYESQCYVYDKKLEDELHRKHYIAANIDR
ncbi:MAG: GGDEF domain-containing protein, partial [Oscillospiraceae bacterium]|nr:GGDEF domain-containing protein [Oscillospiraceae bacterium]